MCILKHKYKLSENTDENIVTVRIITKTKHTHTKYTLYKKHFKNNNITRLKFKEEKNILRNC